MLARNAIAQSKLRGWVLAGLLLPLTGCCGPYICSQQNLYAPTGKGHPGHADCGKGGCEPCSDGQLKLGLPRPILHAISGPFLPHGIADPYQATTHPPHSKFHPVPTGPVFAPRNAYLPTLAPTTAPGQPTLAPSANSLPEPVEARPRPEIPGPSPGAPPRIDRRLPSQGPNAPGRPAETEADEAPTLDQRTAAGRRREGARMWRLNTTSPPHTTIRAASAEARFIDR